MDDSRVRKASDLIGMLLSPTVRDKADAWTRFSGFWKHAAGENLAAHSRVADVRNGIVFVEAEHPGWIQLLQMRQDAILDAVVRTFPELGVSGIAFRLAKDGSPPGTARLTFTGNDAQGDTSPEDQTAGSTEPGRYAEDLVMKTVAQTIEGIEDESFRGIMSSLAGTLEKESRGAKGRGTGIRVTGSRRTGSRGTGSRGTGSSDGTGQKIDPA
jgi:hypothetical protein